jgi:hypothetical protein
MRRRVGSRDVGQKDGSAAGSPIVRGYMRTSPARYAAFRFRSSFSFTSFRSLLSVANYLVWKVVVCFQSLLLFRVGRACFICH